MDPAAQAAAAAAAATAAGFPGLPANLLGGIAAPPGLLVDPATGLGLMLPAALQQQLQQQQPGLGAAALDAAAAGGGGKATAAPATAEGPSAEGAPPPVPADPADPEAVAAALAGRMAAAGAAVIFEKALTASDVSGGGRVVVPKSIAEQYFPRLEAPSGVTISATDLDGRTYTFKWRFWVNNSSRMYLLEGAGELHRNYGLDTGDVMVFAQKPDGSLVVAGRVANKSDMVRKPPAKRTATAANAAAGGGGQGAGSAAGQARGGGRDGRTGRVGGGGAAAVAGAQRAGGPGGAAGAAGGSATTAAALKKRRAAAAAAAAGAADPFFRCRGLPDTWSLSVLDLEAPSDGVFRALVVQPPFPTGAGVGAGAGAGGGQPQLGVALVRSNRWTATLDVAGELYQAFFDTREDAVEALAAAGAPVA